MTVRLGFTLLIFGITACQPRLREADYTATVPAGVSYMQPKVDLEQFAQSKDIQLTENRVVSTSDLYRLAENLTVLEKKYSFLGALVASVTARVRAFSTRIVDTDRSAYTALVIANAAPKVKEAVSGVKAQIQKDIQHIDLVIGGQTPTVPANATIKELGAILVKSLQKFTADLKSKPVSETVKARLTTEVTQIAAQYEMFFTKLDLALNERSSLTAHVRALNQTVTESKIDLSLNGIDLAERLGSHIDQIQDAQSALRTLIEVWKYMSESDRREIIGKLNPDLYKYLSKQDDEDLNCLAKTNCGNLFKAIAKDFAILPAIEKYGVPRIKSELNGKSIAYVDDRIQREIQTILKDLPSVLFVKIHDRIKENIAQLNQFQNTFGSEFKNRLQAFTAKDFAPSAAFTSFPTAGKARLTLADGKLNIGPLTSLGATDANDGAWLGFIAETAKSNQPVSGAMKQMVMSAVEWNAFRYSISKSVRAASNKNSVYETRAEAEKVRGLSMISGYLAPWRNSNFNKVLGQLTMAKLFPEYPADLMAHTLFPIDAILPLVLSNISTGLNRLQQVPSPVLLIDANRNSFPLSKPVDEDQIPVMSVMTDLQNGTAAKQVDTAAIATAILAYSEFILATDGFENANLPLLQARDEKGVSPSEELQVGRAKIRKFIFALCNFLANISRHPEGLIARQVTIPGFHLSATNSVTLGDQALAIRAFTKASEALKNDIYRWEAIALVNRLNSTYLNTDTAFYDLKTGTANSFTDIVEMVVALEELKHHLPEANRTSLEILLKPTVAALSRVK